MGHRFRTSVILAAVVLFVVVAPLFGQAPAGKNWAPPKTPWGDPDLQGIYTSDDLMDTPIERPVEFGASRSRCQIRKAGQGRSRAVRESQRWRDHRPSVQLGRAGKKTAASDVAYCGSA